MVRLIVALIIIAAVLYLFGYGTRQGAQLAGSGGAGARLAGPGNSSSALPPGYRSEGANSPYSSGRSA